MNHVLNWHGGKRLQSRLRWCFFLNRNEIFGERAGERGSSCRKSRRTCGVRPSTVIAFMTNDACPGGTGHPPDVAVAAAASSIRCLIDDCRIAGVVSDDNFDNDDDDDNVAEQIVNLCRVHALIFSTLPFAFGAPPRRLQE